MKEPEEPAASPSEPATAWPSWGHPGARDQPWRLELWNAGTVVRAARAYAGLSQRELAARSGLDPSTIARIESSNTSPRWSIVLRAVMRCGLRFALIGQGGEVIDQAPLVADRDAAGRHYPSHLKVYRVEKPWQWWNGGPDRQPRLVKLSECPPYSYRHRWRTRQRSDGRSGPPDDA